MSCKRLAIRVWFEGDKRHSWVCREHNDCVSTSPASLPPLSATWDSRELAEAYLKKCGIPWSLPLREEPHIVEIDVSASLRSKRDALLAALVSVCSELDEPLVKLEMDSAVSAGELRDKAEHGSTGFFDSHEADVLRALRALEQLEKLRLVVVTQVG